MPLLNDQSQQDIDQLAAIFEKRHPITHNLGVVDKKYIEKARNVEEEGKEVLVSVNEVKHAIELSMSIFRSLHARMFS